MRKKEGKEEEVREGGREKEGVKALFRLSAEVNSLDRSTTLLGLYGLNINGHTCCID